MCDFVPKVVLKAKCFIFVNRVQTEKRRLLKSLLGGLRVVAFSINPYKTSIYFCQTLVNSAKPDQTQQNPASDQFSTVCKQFLFKFE